MDPDPDPDLKVAQITHEKFFLRFLEKIVGQNFFLSRYLKKFGSGSALA